MFFPKFWPWPGAQPLWSQLGKSSAAQGQRGRAETNKMHLFPFPSPSGASRPFLNKHPQIILHSPVSSSPLPTSSQTLKILSPGRNSTGGRWGLSPCSVLAVQCFIFVFYCSPKSSQGCTHSQLAAWGVTEGTQRCCQDWLHLLTPNSFSQSEIFNARHSLTFILLLESTAKTPQATLKQFKSNFREISCTPLGYFKTQRQ